MITWVLCKPCTITTHRRVRYSLKFIECCPQHASSISLPKTWNGFEMEQHFNNILFPFCLHLNWKKRKQELFVSTKYCIQFFYTTKVVQLKMWMNLEWNCFAGKASQWKTFLWHQMPYCSMLIELFIKLTYGVQVTAFNKNRP